MDSFLEVVDLKKSYKKGKIIQQAVDGITFSADKGEILGILGPNGSGKTTIIKSLLGLITYDSGSILVGNNELKNKNNKVLQQCGAVLEGARNTHWRLTPTENIDYFAGIKGLSVKQINEKKEELINTLDLKPVLTKEVSALSRGYQQRVAIASALISSPDLILLDEPTLGLDIESVAKMRELVLEYAKKDKLIIITSHDMKFIDSVCNRIILLKNGKILKRGTTSSFKNMLKQQSIMVKLGSIPSIYQLDGLHQKFQVQEINGIDKTSIIFLMNNESELYDIIRELEIMGAIIKDIKFNHFDLENIFLYLINHSSGDQKINAIKVGNTS